MFSGAGAFRSFPPGNGRMGCEQAIRGRHAVRLENRDYAGGHRLYLPLCRLPAPYGDGERQLGRTP